MSENQAILDRAGALAAEKLKVLKAPEEKAKAEAESKDAASKAEKAEETKKVEGIKIAEAEAKAKEDERILGVKDEELKEPEKKRKAELLEVKKQKENTPDAKIERVKGESQKRIDEIKNELLREREMTNKEIAQLKAELEELKKPKQQEDLESKIKREQAETYTKYVEEDKGKAKEDRREMSKTDLDDWYLEDPVSATEWMQQRTLRRHEEVKKARETAEKKPATNEEKLAIAKELAQKQNESRAKLIERFPSLVPSKDKIIEIRNKLDLPLDRSLNQEEMNRFNEEYGKENEEFRLCNEIAKSNRDYLTKTNGPELVMVEMEKRLKKQPSGEKETYTKEEVDAMIAKEAERLRMLDGEGANSSTNGGKRKVDIKKEKSGNLTADQQRVAAKSKIGTEAYEKMLARRDNISGAGSGKDKDD